MIAAYRAYTGAVAHPDVLRLNRDTIDLQKQLNSIGLAAEPVEALQPLVGAFEGSSRGELGADLESESLTAQRAADGPEALAAAQCRDSPAGDM